MVHVKYNTKAEFYIVKTDEIHVDILYTKGHNFHNVHQGCSSGFIFSLFNKCYSYHQEFLFRIQCNLKDLFRLIHSLEKKFLNLLISIPQNKKKLPQIQCKGVTNQM